MARYTKSACRICRREAIKLFLKGQRCYTDRCALERRQYAPGQHGQKRQKSSGYGIQLREKQKVKKMYGLLERQFRRYFHEAERLKGITGTNLITLLERRLDNMVYRFGFANSRAEARQLVQHGHFLVNGKRVKSPSYLLKIGDTVVVKESSRKMLRIAQSIEAVERRGIATWLELDKANFLGKVKTFPTREEITIPMQEQLIIELYSK